MICQRTPPPRSCEEVTGEHLVRPYAAEVLPAPLPQCRLPSSPLSLPIPPALTCRKLQGSIWCARTQMERSTRCTMPRIGLRVKVCSECRPRQRSFTWNLQ